jgi:hypothetical protein
MNMIKIRWLIVSALALGAIFVGPSRSQADITIQIQELNSGGTVVSSLPTIDLGPTSAGSYPIPTNSTLSYTVSGTVTLGVSSNAASLTTTLNLGFTQGFVAGDTLQIFVNAAGIPNSTPDNSAPFTNSAGASNGLIGGGSVTVASTSTIQGVVTDPSSETITISPSGSSSTMGGSITNGNVSDLPNPYSVLQTISVAVNPSSVNTASTFGGTVSTDVMTNAAAVPAPGGLALALIGIPFVGLLKRRMSKGSTTTD